MPKYAVFEYSAACLSVIFALLPGLIPFASLLHAGYILEEYVYMIMIYSYPTTMYESIFARMYIISGRKLLFTMFALNCHGS